MTSVVLNRLAARLKSKTYWAALMLTAITLLEARSGELSALFKPEYRPYLLLTFPFIMVVLRELTTAALSEK